MRYNNIAAMKLFDIRKVFAETSKDELSSVESGVLALGVRKILRDIEDVCEFYGEEMDSKIIDVLDKIRNMSSDYCVIDRNYPDMSVACRTKVIREIQDTINSAKYLILKHQNLGPNAIKESIQRLMCLEDIFTVMDINRRDDNLFTMRDTPELMTILHNLKSEVASHIQKFQIVESDSLIYYDEYEFDDDLDDDSYATPISSKDAYIENILDQVYNIVDNTISDIENHEYVDNTIYIDIVANMIKSIAPLVRYIDPNDAPHYNEVIQNLTIALSDTIVDISKLISERQFKLAYLPSRVVWNIRSASYDLFKLYDHIGLSMEYGYINSGYSLDYQNQFYLKYQFNKFAASANEMNAILAVLENMEFDGDIKLAKSWMLRSESITKLSSVGGFISKYSGIVKLLEAANMWLLLEKVFCDSRPPYNLEYECELLYSLIYNLLERTNERLVLEMDINPNLRNTKETIELWVPDITKKIQSMEQLINLDKDINTILSFGKIQMHETTLYETVFTISIYIKLVLYRRYKYVGNMA